MREAYEVELQVALAEGLLSQGEAERLGEEVRLLKRSPLELLRERGRLTEDTFLSLKAEAHSGSLTQSHLALPSPASAEVPAFPVPQWDRYSCVRFLGQGGMGRVFLARDLRLHRDVALKFVRDEGVESTRRFLSEARAQARVKHERVCKVYEVGETQGRVYIAMEYIDGVPLNLLAHELTVEQKVMLVRDAAHGVHEAHRVGLIHRDLKPSNIMVDRTADGARRAYVMDFGLARDWTHELTAPGAVLGTPHYMAPEQARGEVATLDRRADVYSLGATLYSLLTGRPPIPGDNGLEVLNHIAAYEPVAPRALVPALPVDLEAIVLKCLEKDRSARYDSARALAEDLDRFLSAEPVQARAVGPWYRLGKWLRRHRALAAVAGVALLAVMLALGWAGLQRREALQREWLARHFTERVERIEAAARYSALSRLHDTRADRQALRASLAELEEEVHRAGAPAVGLGHSALGRGLLALGDEEKAREHLEAAWAEGLREPRLSWALALVMGHLYQRQLLEVERLRDPEQRRARKLDIERLYRDPALVYLRLSQGAEVPSLHYVDALLAFYEDRPDEALDHLDAIGGGAPWFYEVPQLRGDILHARATRRWNEGDRERGLADFEKGRQAYALASSIGESVPGISESLGELEYAAMTLELYGKGDVLPHFTQGLEAVHRTLEIDPDDLEARTLHSRLYRRRAEDLVNHGRDAEEALKTALAATQEALALEPTWVPARRELINISLQWAQDLQARGQDPRGQLDRALQIFESLPTQAHDFPLHMQRGLVHELLADNAVQNGRECQRSLDEAIDAYRAALQHDEHSSRAWTSLGSVYLARVSCLHGPQMEEDLGRALSALDTARSLNPQYVPAFFYAAEAHVQRSAQLARRGVDARPELAQALALYEQGMVLKPNLTHLYNGAGIALTALALEEWERGGEPFARLTQALTIYEKALALAPEQGFAQNNLGVVHAQRAHYLLALGRAPLSELRLAASAYRAALEHIPGYAMLWANQGELWNMQATWELEQGQSPEATLSRASEALRDALARNPRLDDAWLQFGETRALQARWHALQGRGRAEEFTLAQEAFQKAMELTPSNQLYRLAFGRFCREWAVWQEQTGQDFRPTLQRGLSAVEGVLASRPDWAAARALHAGLGLLRVEDRQGAREQLSQALKLNPNLEHEWKERP